MRPEPEYSLVGEGLGMRDYWLYVWLRRAAVVLAHLTGLGLTLIISLLSRPGTSLFSWHPLCMSVAYCLCLTEAVLLFSAEGSFFCFTSRKGKVRLHWFFQALVLVAAATGLGFMVASKNVSERPHLASWHSVLGACTLCSTALQAGCGLLAGCPRSSGQPRLRLYHATTGLLVYLLATATVMLAMFSDWFQGTVKGAAWWAFLLLPLFPALVVMNQITNAYLPRKKTSS
ncbi:putative transmembrane reductase CYB561D1 [Salarias fasciatus]|uniref:ascorbate ferrireductase (transmembrane) n=1 Tax=Salarias fasciatus TaxID=181472 RepID=A0A672I3S0_SALFA|nr:cytochrome b561 domain-containing protein 1 [Salarias fasciatus]XP_029947625.1 cytochrome b561 domain-containing protein 1 [Salarias fasciatus]